MLASAPALARSRADQLASLGVVVAICAWAVTTFAAWWYHVSVGDRAKYNRDPTLWPCGRALQAMLLHAVVAIVVVARVVGMCVRAGPGALPSPASLLATVLPPMDTLATASAVLAMCAYAILEYVESATDCSSRLYTLLGRCVLLATTCVAIALARQARRSGICRRITRSHVSFVMLCMLLIGSYSLVGSYRYVNMQTLRVRQAQRRFESEAAHSKYVASLFAPIDDPPGDSACKIEIGIDAAGSKSYNARTVDKRAVVFNPGSCGSGKPRGHLSARTGELIINGNYSSADVSLSSLDRFALAQEKGSGIGVPFPKVAYTKHATPLRIRVPGGFARVTYTDGRREVLSAPVPRVAPRRVNEERKGAPPPNILILAVDSLARRASLWTLPRTMAFLREIKANATATPYHAYVFNQAGSTGHSTAPSMTPVLTGRHFDMSLDDERIRTRRYANPAVRHDDWITAHARRNGYVTAYGTTGHDNLFMGNTWWNRTIFDHVMPPLDTRAATEHVTWQLALGCIGHGGRVFDHNFDYLRTMWNATYGAEVPKFAYYHAMYGHGAIERATVMDASIVRLLKDMLHTNTVVFFIGDHGPYSSFISKAPLVTMLLPKAMIASGSAGSLGVLADKLLATTLGNERLTVSQFDLYHTMKDLMYQRATVVSSPSKKHGMSLISQHVPRDRTCADAGISDWRCMCGAKRTAVPDAAIPRGLLDLAIEHINVRGHDKAPDACARLDLDLALPVGLVPSSATAVPRCWRLGVKGTCTFKANGFEVADVVFTVSTRRGLQFTFEVTLNVRIPQIPAHQKHSPSGGLRVVPTKATHRWYDQPGSQLPTFVIAMNAKQLTRYAKYEKCTPPAASAQYCVCGEAVATSTTS
jgi:hypothetical protein